jgi:hypothetical protein
MWGRAAALLMTVGAAFLGACGNSISDPSSGTLTDVAAADAITVQVLPSPVAAQAQVYGVSPGGYVVAIFQNAAGGFDHYAWTAPYGGPATFIGNGALGPSSALNSLGDTPGENAQQVAGSWLRGADAWQFQAASTGGHSTVVTMALNDAREMVGGSYDTGASRHALWWSSPLAEPVDLPFPPLSGRVGFPVWGARALNTVGTLVGAVYDTVGAGRRLQVYQHGVVWSHSTEGFSVALLPDMAASNLPIAINDAGQILGVLGSAPGSASGAGLWTPNGSGYTATVVSTSWAAAAMDRCGRIVGTKTVNNKRMALLRQSGIETLLPTPPGYAETDAKGITTDAAAGKGIIVGTAYPKGSGLRVAAMWTLSGCP